MLLMTTMKVVMGIGRCPSEKTRMMRSGAKTNTKMETDGMKG